MRIDIDANRRHRRQKAVASAARRAPASRQCYRRERRPRNQITLPISAKKRHRRRRHGPDQRKTTAAAEVDLHAAADPAR